MKFSGFLNSYFNKKCVILLEGKTQAQLEVVNQSKFQKNTSRLINKFVDGGGTVFP